MFRSETSGSRDLLCSSIISHRASIDSDAVTRIRAAIAHSFASPVQGRFRKGQGTSVVLDFIAQGFSANCEAVRYATDVVACGLMHQNRLSFFFEHPRANVSNKLRPRAACSSSRQANQSKVLLRMNFSQAGPTERNSILVG